MRQPVPPPCTRRSALTSTLGLLLASSLPPMPLLAADNSLPSSSLLKLIPEMEFGAPATNATISAALAQEIESSAAALERLGAKDLAVAPTLSDSWRLVYSNGREITNLASGLPLGFALGRTFQPLDVPTGRFENIGQIEHKLGLATASTLVIGDVRRAPLGTLNAAGTVNAAGNRVDVDFRRLVFGLDSVLGRPLDPPLRKVIVPQQKAGVAQPANDVTYLDGVCRVTRGGDDSLFIFRREPSDRPMLSLEERAALYAEGGESAETGSGKAAGGAPPELRALLRQ